MVDIWREKVKVGIGSVDRSIRLSMWSIVNYFQEAAICHAEDLGVGRDALADKGQAWILSRLSVFAARRPAHEEILTISTWPRRWEKLFALRDYEIRDAREKTVARGRAGWLMLDLEKRRPLRPETLLESLPANEGIDAFPAGPAALNPKEPLSKFGERTAAYSDIDFFGHVNNARYVQWIQDASDADVLANADQMRLDINYLSEVKPGETVELWTAPLTGLPDNAELSDYPQKNAPGFAYEGRRPGSGQAVFRAELRCG